MTSSLRIRVPAPGELPPFVELVRSTFDAFIAPDCEAIGVRRFRELTTLEGMQARLGAGYPTWIAECDGRAVGFLQVRLPAHLLLLFVHAEHQRQGIARRLLDRTMAELAAKNDPPSELTVNASPFSVAVYRRLGFREQGTVPQQGGIPTVPMALELGSRN